MQRDLNNNVPLMGIPCGSIITLLTTADKVLVTSTCLEVSGPC